MFSFYCLMNSKNIFLLVNIAVFTSILLTMSTIDMTNKSYNAFAQSGNATSAQSGNATSAQSGNATSAQSGNATSAQSGNATSAQSGNAPTSKIVIFANLTNNGSP